MVAVLKVQIDIFDGDRIDVIGDDESVHDHRIIDALFIRNFGGAAGRRIHRGSKTEPFGADPHR